MLFFSFQFNIPIGVEDDDEDNKSAPLSANATPNHTYNSMQTGGSIEATIPPGNIPADKSIALPGISSGPAKNTILPTALPGISSGPAGGKTADSSPGISSGPATLVVKTLVLYYESKAFQPRVLQNNATAESAVKTLAKSMPQSPFKRLRAWEDSGRFQIPACGARARVPPRPSQKILNL